jgi:radical SAM protein with 4Fe4S-binding SPASM domain
MNYIQLKSKLIKESAKKNIPILGEFELTSKCNFKCPMCYVSKLDTNHDMDTETWKLVFDEAIKNGLMFANLTGGEVFTRSDFIELYEYLFDKGIKITIFTNGSLLNAEILDVLRRKKPHYIAITLYGFDNDSYEVITKNKNAFDKVTENIKALKDSNINIMLRTLPLKIIYDNLNKIINLSKSLDSNLYYLSYITKSNCFDTRNERLSSKQLVDFEERINKAFNYNDLGNIFEDNYKSCSALRSSYFINYKGEMQPCALAYKPVKDILENDFLETFKELGIKFKELEEKNLCFDCEFLTNCSSCYARRISEEGNAKCAKYLRENSISRSNLKYYQIADLIIGLDYTYDDFLTNNIENYAIDDYPCESYNLRTHYVNSIKLPKRKPDMTYSTRLIFEDGLSEEVYALNENDEVMQKYTRSSDLRRIDIDFNKNVEQRFIEKEYVFTGIAFMEIAAFNGKIPLHGSGIICNDEAIVFSAPSKTGKSTHANYWIEAFEDIEIFNDDKPLIYQKDDRIVVAGTPWSGKSTINKNIVLPLKCIVFLEQGKTNELRELDNKDKITYLMRNILRPREEEIWNRMWETLEIVIKEIPMYIASVTNDIESAKIIKSKLFGGKS